MKKKLELGELQNQLADSVFFRKSKATSPQPAEKPPASADLPPARAETTISPVPALHQHSSPDVTTSARHDVSLKHWREIIENTETQNSALRLTPTERYAVEDLLQDLRRKHKIKSSMNELARLGLLFLIEDYRNHKEQSLACSVKKA